MPFASALAWKTYRRVSCNNDIAQEACRMRKLVINAVFVKKIWSFSAAGAA